MVKQKGYELVNKKKETELVSSPLHNEDIEAPEEILIEPEKGPSPWWKVAALIIPPNWRGRLRFLVCIIFLISSKLAMLASPMALSVAIDSMEHDGSKAAIAIIIYGILRFSTDLLSNLQSQTWSSVSADITKVVACLLFEHLHALSLRWHLNRKTGATLSQMERGVAGVSSMIQYSLFTLAPTLLQLMLVSVIFWQLDVPSVVVCLVLSAGAYIAATVLLTKWRIPQRKARNTAANNVTNRAVDSLINFETVKYFAAEHVEAKRYADLRDIQKEYDIEVATSLAFLNVTQSFIIQAGLISSLLFAAAAVSKGNMTPGDFVACQLYVLELFRPLSFLGTVWTILVNAATDCVEIDALLRVTPEVLDDADVLTLPSTSATTPGGYGGLSVRFEKVCFTYGPGLPGIKDVSFDIKPGGSIALVGPSGSGKSTTGRLLCRLYEVESGAIKVGKIDIRKISQRELRSVISVVAQETVLFNETVFFNVAYGLPGATKEQVEEACRKAQLHDKIISWPDGYETNVGERGLRLSGGEKQRLGIARALVRDPAILLLDEATSALDTTTERQIQSAFDAASEGRTTISIAHRLSTIINANEIIVLRDGEVAERGSHAELLDIQEGIFKQMWEAQQEVEALTEEDSFVQEEGGSKEEKSGEAVSTRGVHGDSHRGGHGGNGDSHRGAGNGGSGLGSSSSNGRIAMV